QEKGAIRFKEGVEPVQDGGGAEVHVGEKEPVPAFEGFDQRPVDP
ncbi:hypothetical protein NGA_2131000, partial [Nannochloropsis gaditana CCMP526]